MLSGVFALCAAPAKAETRALVVGVSGYPNLAESIRLLGPKNDSREMANTLARLGVPSANITVLADGVSGLADGIEDGGPGTKQAILDRLDRLAEASEPGDLIVFYFSGHGSQQPDIDGDEGGGADEIILPYDVGSWGSKGVENALVDDELNARVERILDRGADFFGIIDACHSSTGFRALDGDDTRSRRVDPSSLGVPEFGQPITRGLFAGKRSADRRGRAAFFYAAQEDEEALEKTPPNGEDGESFAVFTFHLLARMNQTPGLTYRALHQAVMSDIKRNTLMSTQTPELEGELLDEQVLGLPASGASRQWPLQWGGKLQAGALQGFTAGTLLALYDDAAAPDDRPIGYGSIDSAGSTRSIVVPAAAPCDSGESCAGAIDEEAFKTARFARPVARGVDLGLVLSEPIRVDPADGHDYGAVVAALRQATARGTVSPRVSLRASGYDVAVGLVDGTLAFSPAGGMIDRNGPGSSPRLTLPGDTGDASERIAEAIDRMARVTALQRLGGVEQADALGLSPSMLVSRSKSGPVADGSCDPDRSAYEPAVPVDDGPTLGECDILSIALRNTGRKPLDVTVLLIGADFSIVPVWPVEGDANRVRAQESKTADILQMEPNPKATTEERLVFLAVPGVNRSHTAFTELEQEGLRASLTDDAPEIAKVRDFLRAGLTEQDRSSLSRPAGVDEDLSIEIRSFFAVKGGS